MGVVSLQYNSVTDELMLLGTDKKLTFLSVQTQKVVSQLQADVDSEPTSIAISPDGQLIVVGNDQGEMKLFT